jgi:outer membrane protein OmpA-like peptidoglycan-associated protein
MWDPVAMLGNLSGYIPGMQSFSLPQLPQIGLPSFSVAPAPGFLPGMQSFSLPQLPQIGLPSVSVAPAPAATPAPIPEPAPVAKPAAVPAPIAAPAPVAAPAPAPVVAPAPVAAPAPVVAPQAAVVAQPVAPAANKVVLAGDALFKLGKSGIKDLSKDGKGKLDAVVAKLKGMGAIEQIKVVGHADPTGNAKSNLRLSEARAKSIKSYLIAKGVKPNVIITSGMGDTQPVVQCAADLPKAELKECHAPNRRVEIEIVAKPK